MINKTSEQLRTLMKLSAFFYFDRSRALLLVFGLLFVAVSAHAEIKIHALTKVIEGHSTGGVTVDALGNIYVADFGEIVWKITPKASVTHLHQVFTAHPATRSIMKAISCNRISTATRSLKSIEKVKRNHSLPAA